MIRESYSHPSRRYHNLSHVVVMLVGMDNFNESLSCPHLVQLAIFFHALVCFLLPVNLSNFAVVMIHIHASKIPQKRVVFVVSCIAMK